MVISFLFKMTTVVILARVFDCYPRPYSFSSSSSSMSPSYRSTSYHHTSTYFQHHLDSCQLRLDYTSIRFENTASRSEDGGGDGGGEDGGGSGKDASSSSGSSVLTVYAGNGYTYAINCHVNDAKMRPGDKYYVIDLIVYGPNQRVAKAWREQFTAASLFATSKSFFINKSLSFYWLGENNIVCAVSLV